MREAQDKAAEARKKAQLAQLQERKARSRAFEANTARGNAA